MIKAPLVKFKRLVFPCSSRFASHPRNRNTMKYKQEHTHRAKQDGNSCAVPLASWHLAQQPAQPTTLRWPHLLPPRPLVLPRAVSLRKAQGPKSQEHGDLSALIPTSFHKTVWGMSGVWNCLPLTMNMTFHLSGPPNAKADRIAPTNAGVSKAVSGAARHASPRRTPRLFVLPQLPHLGLQ